MSNQDLSLKPGIVPGVSSVEGGVVRENVAPAPSAVVAGDGAVLGVPGRVAQNGAIVGIAGIVATVRVDRDPNAG